MPAIAVLSAARTTPSGTYLNAGDELLTRRLVGWLRRELPEARIVRSLGGRVAPSDGGDPLADAVIDPRDLARCWRTMGASDLVLIGGGTLLQSDAPGGRVPSGMVRYVATIAAMCRLRGVPHSFVGVGAELPDDRRDRALLVTAARGADACLVRDEASAAELRTQGVAATVAGDVYLLPGSPAPVPQPSEGDRTGIIAPRADLTAADATRIGELVAGHPDVDRWLVVGMHRDPAPGGHDDLAALALLEPVLAGRTWSTLDATVDPGALPEQMAAAECCIAMRLHAAYVALDAGTPLELVGQATKVRRLAADLTRGADDGGAEAWVRDAQRHLHDALRAEVHQRIGAPRRARTAVLGIAT